MSTDKFESASSVTFKRREAHRQEGALAQTFRVAMQVWDAQVADGISRADRIHGLTQTLRAAWPQTRAWRFYCDQCDDRGLVMAECPGRASCGRQNEHLPHDYGRPCSCQAGNRFKRPEASPDDYAQAGKTKKKSGFTRF
jgi:hypothetical protein